MKNILLVCGVLFSLTSCVSYQDYYKLDENYLARRQMETARFEANDESAVLSASAQVLQDLGFTLEESETSLGLITASKNREIGNYGAKMAMVFLMGLNGQQAVYDTEQKIYTTLVSTKSRTNVGYNVRVEFSRIIWNNQGNARIEKIEEPEIYKDFFDKLSQSLFLEAHSI